MFKHDFKEKDAAEIELPGKKFDDMLELMEVLHPPNKDIDAKNVEALLALAREYQMDGLTFKCQRYLLSQTNCVKNLALAEEYQLEELKEKSMKNIVEKMNLDSIVKSGNFDDLMDCTKAHIFQKKISKFHVAIINIRRIMSGFCGRNSMVRKCISCSDYIGSNVSCSECSHYMIGKIRWELKDLN